LIATYNPAEAVGRNHPLLSVREELLEHQLCREVVLPILGEADVLEYLTQRFATHAFPVSIARSIQQQAGGNPLLLVKAADRLEANGLIPPDDRQGVLNLAPEMTPVDAMKPTPQITLARDVLHFEESARAPSAKQR
jgi:hypothetical protein